MASVDAVLATPPPLSLEQARAFWPTRAHLESPTDWRDELIYFLLPDRFSDDRDRAPLDRADLASGRGGRPQWDDESWQQWAESGKTRFQGGTLKGVTRRLDYLADLGVTTLWLGPVWKQRKKSDQDGCDSYHGYAIQNFLDVDPRFGSRADLVNLVDRAHEKGLKVIFDVIVNHTAENFLYEVDGDLISRPPFVAGVAPYAFGAWLDSNDQRLPRDAQPGPDDAVWPIELQRPSAYHLRGSGSYADDNGISADPNAPYRLSDYINRDLKLTGPPGNGDVLNTIIGCWQYWIALTDCDGFRIDTVKHVAPNEARVFCNAIKEFAYSLGKHNFFLIGEIGGGRAWEDKYLSLLGCSLDAALELGENRDWLKSVGWDLGDNNPGGFLGLYQREDPANPDDTTAVASQRVAGSAFVISLDDHDDLGNKGVFGVRFPRGERTLLPPADARRVDDYFWPLQAVPGCALLLFTLGIPSLYYGTEQGLAGPALARPRDLPGFPDGPWGDRYLREAMFGPEHPRLGGRLGCPEKPGEATEDRQLPGFGPFGTSGRHVFDPDGAVYRRVRQLLRTRAEHSPLRAGRQYARDVRSVDRNGNLGQAEGVLAWSRILADDEVLVVVNRNPTLRKSIRINLDSRLTVSITHLRVAASTCECDNLNAALITGTELPVAKNPDGTATIDVPGLPPHEVVVLVNERLVQ